VRDVLAHADWQAIIDLNLVGPVRLDRAFVPGMIERGSGVVTHIGSVSARLPIAVKAVFETCLSKWGRLDCLFNNAGGPAPSGSFVASAFT
jgi:NAD(P)-dependent dehydrogenase (short-subunit alcohol dehydrogenase family)